MPDVVDVQTRSRMMAGIKASHTKPEVTVRRMLHSAGYRFRLHRRDLPGSPDVVLPKYDAAIFINGCFWHGHACPLFKIPGTRPDFWAEKIQKNRDRDVRATAALQELGWRVLTIWECALRSPRRYSEEEVLRGIIDWLNSASNHSEIAGRGERPAVVPEAL